MSKPKNWYLPDATTHELIGPLSQSEIEAKLKNGELRADDFIWSRHLKAARWVRIYEVQDFQSLLKPYPAARLPRASAAKKPQAPSAPLDYSTAKAGEYGRENVFRRYPRVPLEVDVIVHDNAEIRTARSVDISEKGASIVLHSGSPLEKGQDVVVVFRNVPNDVGTFSAAGVVVRAPEKSTSGGIVGVFFLRLNPKYRRLLAQYVLATSVKEAA